MALIGELVPGETPLTQQDVQGLKLPYQLTDECRALRDHLMPPAIRRLATQGIRPRGA